MSTDTTTGHRADEVPPPPTAATTAATAEALTRAVNGIAPLLTEWSDLRRRMLRVAGVQVAVRVGGELVLSTASGSADLERDIPLTTDHLFRIASHSKTFAATSVMILVQEGRLRLDDSVADHIAELADTPLADCTVRELIGHQAGVIRDGDDCDYWQLTRNFPDTATLLDDLHRDGVTFGRNEYFKYSNYGFSIVGLIIERVSGMSFNDFTRARIMTPLGLDRVHPDVDGVPAAQLAMGHSLLLDAGDTAFVVRNPSTGAMSAATGFVACAEDLAAYGSAHVMSDERLLSDGTKRLMQRTETIVAVDDTELGRYGLGLELHTVGKRKLVGHSGGFPGFVTRTFIDPQDALVVSVLTNSARGPAHEIACGIIKLIDLALTKQQLPADVPAGVDLDSFTGTLVAGFGRTTIARFGEHLVLLHPDQDDPSVEAAELTVQDADTLMLPHRQGYGSAGEPVHVVRNSGGAITSMRIGGMQAWPEQEFVHRRIAQMARSESGSDGHG